MKGEKHQFQDIDIRQTSRRMQACGTNGIQANHRRVEIFRSEQMAETHTRAHTHTAHGRLDMASGARWNVFQTDELQHQRHSCR